mmetsp:Transcript_11403/g.20353  ORF Transcript_11403/g.20353 Transcript_11403/m.20353 type:complete len:117 (+) Transcript_11403:273-623(+)
MKTKRISFPLPFNLLVHTMRSGNNQTYRRCCLPFISYILQSICFLFLKVPSWRTDRVSWPSWQGSSGRNQMTVFVLDISIIIVLLAQASIFLTMEKNHRPSSSSCCCSFIVIVIIY